MIRSAFIVVSAFAASLAAATPEQAVQDAEKAWSTAVVAADTATLDRVLGADLSYSHSSGDMDTKTSYIGRIRSGNLKYISFKYDEGKPDLRIYGSTAVLIASAQIRSVTNGVEAGMHLRFLHVYVRRNGQWQLVAHQSVKLTK